MHITLIDDADDFRELMQDLVEMEGHEIKSFSTTPEQLPDTDILLVDWNISGVKMEEYIKSMNRDSVKWVYVISGQAATTEFINQLRNIGVNGLLTKPVDPDDLLPLLSEPKEKWS